MFVPFGQFAPDLQDLGNQAGLTGISNAIPTQTGYRHFKGLSTFSDALPTRCYGGIAARDSASNVYVYTGTASKLYRLLSAAWQDVSSLTIGTYSTGATDRWQFAQWNQNIIATNGTDPVQNIALGGANFDDLAGSPPVAKHLAVVRDFIVLGNTEDNPSEVRWSGFNDAESWAVSSTTQAGLQPLRGGAGWVQAIIGGEYGVVLCERGVFLMQYIGSPIVWQFDEVLPDVGTPASGSATRIGDMVFFLGQDGFYSLTQGQQWKRIGANRVDSFFWNDLNATYIRNVRAAVDKNAGNVYWIYPNKQSTDGTPNRVLIYSWVNDRWGSVGYSLEELFMTALGGSSLDQLGGLGSIDDLNISFDDAAFAGDSLSSFGGIGTDHAMGFFNGSALAAEFITAEGELVSGRRSLVNSVRPVIDGGDSPTVAVGSRNEQSDAVVYTGNISLNRNQTCPFRVNARYTRAKVNVTGPFTDALGVDYEATDGGA